MSRAVPWDRAACGARPGVAGGVAGALGRLGQREPVPALHSAAGDLGAAAGDLGAGRPSARSAGGLSKVPQVTCRDSSHHVVAV